MNRREKYPLTEDFWSCIQGIPCQIRITDYSPGCAGDHPGMGPPMSYASIQAPEPEDWDYEVYDRKGYRARWLEDRISSADEDRITEDFHEHSERERAENAAAAAEYRMEARYGY